MLFNYCPHTARARQHASATPRAKIALIPISDADRAESRDLRINPSPHWFIEAGTHVPSPHLLYPRG